jgi:hypothetical protein
VPAAVWNARPAAFGSEMTPSSPEENKDNMSKAAPPPLRAARGLDNGERSGLDRGDRSMVIPGMFR